MKPSTSIHNFKVVTFYDDSWTDDMETKIILKCKDCNHQEQRTVSYYNIYHNKCLWLQPGHIPRTPPTKPKNYLKCTNN